MKPLFLNKFTQVATKFQQESPGDQGNLCPNVENAGFDEMRGRICRAIDEFSGYKNIHASSKVSTSLMS